MESRTTHGTTPYYRSEDMGDIEKLTPTLINQIAAGEVIERPSSVVRELVENAIDAGATAIEIQLEEGGKKRICVSDDGEGIEPADLSLAVESHATSKITSQEELRSIETLGFRGEALASIASVSEVTITSRPGDREMARQIRVRGGEAEDLEETSAPPGTRVDVRNLFFCTPARRKFMKNTGTELGHCTDRATEFAISHPSIRFEVEHEGERMFTLPPVDTPRDRIGRFFGSDLAEKLVSFREETHFGTFHGYMGPPSLYRPNANRLYFFLNGRAIDSRDLYQSVLEAYSGMIPGRKKPVLFLFCDLDPDEVDVNVHPAKQEVRFRRRWKLRNTLTDRLRDRLESLKEPVTATGDLTETDLAPGRGPSTDAEEQQEDIRNAIESFFEDEDSDPTRTRNGSGSRGNDSPGVPTSSGYRTTDRGFLQVHDMFLVEEVEEGLLVIDQHALHERIIFHDLHHRLEKDRIPRQKLLSPAVVDVTQVEKQVIDEKQPVLQQVGLEVEPFGRGTVAVRSMPAMLDNTRPDQLLLSTIEDLREGVGETESRNRVDRLLRLISCHSAVKAGDPLQEEEIEELLIRRKEVDTAHACVHGRPTSLKLSVEDLEKRFERK